MTDSAGRAEGLIVAPYTVSVPGSGSGTFHAGSRGKALAAAWRDHAAARGGGSFREFMRVARIRRAEPVAPFGTPITVSGRPAFLIEATRHQIRFVHAGGDVVMTSHPLDVEPASIRALTAYGAPDGASRPREA